MRPQRREASANLLMMIWKSRLPMCYEGTVVSKDSLFHSLCVGCQSAKVEQGAVTLISWVHSLFKVPDGMV